MLWPSIAETAEGLGVDAHSSEPLVAPFMENPHGFFEDVPFWGEAQVPWIPALALLALVLGLLVVATGRPSTRSMR